MFNLTPIRGGGLFREDVDWTAIPRTRQAEKPNSFSRTRMHVGARRPGSRRGLIVRPGAFSARILPERISADRHETGKRERELAKDHAAQ